MTAPFQIQATARSKTIVTALALVLATGIGATQGLAQTPAAAGWTAAGSTAVDRAQLRRVVMSSGGVAYLELEQTASTDGTVAFDVRRDQLDDVLKSLLVFSDSGRVAAVRAPAETPLEYAFRDLPFGPDAVASPARLLNALRGAEIRVSGIRALGGRIVSATPETARTEAGATAQQTRVLVMGPAGLQSFVWEQVDSVSFTDVGLDRRFRAAMEVLADASPGGVRRVEVDLTAGAGTDVAVGYVVSAPVWKSSYRLVLPRPGGETDGQRSGQLDGRAHVENLSGRDWTGIDLTLVSGNPVTLRQAIASAYFVDRPLVPIEVPGRVLPPLDRGAIPAAADDFGRARERAMQAAPPPVATAAAPALAPSGPRPGTVLELAEPSPESIPQAEAASAQILFRLPSPVTLDNGHTAALPLVNGPVPASRIALYDPSVDQRHPLAAVRIENGFATTLPPGLIALYETRSDGTVAFVGDARMPAVPAGESRLLSFALEREISVERSERPSRTFTIVGLADGVLRRRIVTRLETDYTVTVAGPDRRRVTIIQPQPGADWTVRPIDGVTVERADGQWRLTGEVDTGVTTVRVVAEQPLVETIAVGGFDPERVIALIRDAELTADQQRAFTAVTQRQSALATAQTALREAEQRVERIGAEQERLRRNLQAVPQGTDLSRRYLADLERSEARLTEANGARDQAENAVRTARAALSEAVRAIRL